MISPEEAEIIKAHRELGPMGRRVLGRIAERLVIGRRFYKDDFERSRDWKEETQQELFDGLVYLAVENEKRLDVG